MCSKKKASKSDIRRLLLGDEFADDDGDEDSNTEASDPFFSRSVSRSSGLEADHENEEEEEGGAMLEYIPEDEAKPIDYDHVMSIMI